MTRILLRRKLRHFFAFSLSPLFYSSPIYRIGLRRLHFKLIEYLAKCLSALPSKLFTARRQSILAAVSLSFSPSLSASFFCFFLQKKSISLINTNDLIQIEWTRRQSGSAEQEKETGQGGREGKSFPAKIRTALENLHIFRIFAPQNIFRQ